MGNISNVHSHFEHSIAQIPAVQSIIDVGTSGRIHTTDLVPSQVHSFRSVLVRNYPGQLRQTCQDIVGEGLMWDIMFQEQNLIFRVLLPNFSQGPDVVPNGILGVFGPSVNNNNDSLTQQRVVLPSLDSNFGVPDVNLLSELNSTYHFSSVEN